MDVLIDGVGMIPQFAAAISAIQNVRKKVLFAVFRFRRTAFCVAQECLHGFEIFAVYNRFVDIFEYHIEDLRDQIGETDISLDLPGAVLAFLGDLFIGAGHRANLARCFALVLHSLHFHLVGKSLF